MPSRLEAKKGLVRRCFTSLVAEGDKVAVLNSLRGRHTGMFLGLEARQAR